MQVGKGMVALRCDVFMLCGALEPTDRHRVTFLDPHASGVALAQCELRHAVRFEERATVGQSP